MMPKELFNLKFTLIILAVCLVPALIFIAFNGAGTSYNMVTKPNHFNGIISGSIHDKGTNKYSLKDRNYGFYFFYEEEESEKTKEAIHAFIIWNKTRVVKPKNKSIVYYINGTDTLKVDYKINSSNLVLHSGHIIP